jgi:anti-sigma B factor antagonist
MPEELPESRIKGLTLQTYEQHDATIIQCAGWLTIEHSQDLKNHVKDVIPRSKRIVLDLKQVTRMDSSGLGAIVGAYVSAKRANCDFLLVNYSKSVRDLLGIANLLSVFETCAQSGVRF